MLAVTPQMLTDLNLGQAGVLVHGPIVYLEDGFGYFSGGFGASDYELWKTDGTPTGTVLVKDINPGAGGSRPGNLIDVGGTLFFTADDGADGIELWKSNGTAGGTVLVKDILAGAGGSTPALLTAVNGKLFFTAFEFTDGTELWKSDGTSGGTVLVKDIVPGFFSPRTSEMVNFNGTLFFNAAQTFSDYQLWKSDGTSVGTVKVTSVAGGVFGLNPEQLTPAGALAMFFTADSPTAGKELWKTDGTAGGTAQVSDIRPGTIGSYPDQLRALPGGIVVFTASDATTGRELWSANSTSASQLMDIRPGSISSNPDQLTYSLGKIYFTANDGVHGVEPWFTTGSGLPGSTQMIGDLMVGSAGSNPSHLTAYYNGIAFGANFAFGLGQLWTFDTFLGPRLIFPYVASVDQGLQNFADLGSGKLVFAANDGFNGPELWRSDGAPQLPTLKIPRDFTSTEGSGANDFTQVGSTLYFAAIDATRGNELARTNGTAAGTTFVEASSGPLGGAPTNLTELNGQLVFSAYDPTGAVRLWTSNGTVPGTLRIMPPSGGDFSDPSGLININGKLFFSATRSSYNGLWVTDGTNFGTQKVEDVAGGTGGVSLSPKQFTNVNGRLFFVGTYFSFPSTTGSELFTSDGTESGTQMLKKTGLNIVGNPHDLTAVGSTLYYVASDGTNANELWKSDGTLAGTTLVKATGSSVVTQAPDNLVNVNGTLYFTADDGTNGVELWKSNGTPGGTVMVKDIRSLGTSNGSYPQELTNVNGTLFFTADDGTSGRELWKSDGTAAGTMLVKETAGGLSSGQPGNLTNLRGALFFTANTFGSGRELWRSDGTSAGTAQLFEVAPGALSSAPREITAYGRQLLFTADDGTHGREGWITQPEINVAPTAANKMFTTLEGVPYTFAESDFGFSDLGNVLPDNLLSVLVNGTTIDGTLKLNGAPVTFGANVSAADLRAGKLVYTPPTNAGAGALAMLNFLVRDDGGTAGGGADTSLTGNAVTVLVQRVNDAPSGADGSINVLDHVPYTFAFNEFGFSDPNDTPPDTFQAVKVTKLPTAGLLKLGNANVTAGMVIFTAATNLTYTPDASAFSSQTAYTTLQFQVQDSGGTANGGSDLDPTARTLTINLVGTHTAPVGAGKTVSVNEDGALTFATGDFSFSDPGDSPADLFTGVKIATLPAAGTLKNGTQTINLGEVIPVANLPTLTYQPASNANGTAYARFTFQVRDNGDTSGGGSNLDPTPRTMTIDVTSVNDAPTGADKTIPINEDKSYTFAAGDFGFADASDASPPSSQLANNLGWVMATSPPAAAGVLKVGSSTFSPGIQVTVTKAQIDAGSVVFVPAADINSLNAASPTLAFRVQDNGGTSNGGADTSTTPNTITFNITAVNDAPTGADKTVNMLEDQSYTFALADFGFIDDDFPANGLSAVRIVQAPLNGTLSSEGNGLGNGSVVSKATIDAGGLVFMPAANGSSPGTNPPYDKFTFKVQDDGGAVNGGVDTDLVPRTMSLAVTPVNDPPSGAGKTITINEDGTYTLLLADFSFSDLNDMPAPNSFRDLIIPSAPIGGTLKNGAATITAFPATFSAPSLGSITFTLAADKNSAGGASFLLPFNVEDDGSPQGDPSGIDPITRTLTFNVNSVNDPPVGTGKLFSIDEDVPKTFSIADFGFSDAKDAAGGTANTLQAVVIASAPLGGSVMVGTTAVGAGDSVAAAAINAGQMVFVPTPNANGATTASFGFTFQVRDDGGTAFGGSDLDATARTMTFTVNPVNDAPSGADNTVATFESISYTFGPSEFGFSDTSDTPPNSFLGVVIAGLPAAGSLKLSGSDVAALQLISRSNLVAGNLVYVPPAGFSGLMPFTFQVRDGGGTTNGGIDLDPTARTMSINVQAVNHAPSFVGGGDKDDVSDESGPLSFSSWATAIAAGPASEAAQHVHFAIQNVSNPAIFLAGPNLSADGKLTFTPAPNTPGTSQVTIVLIDDGGAANGGHDTSQPLTFAVTVIKPHVWHNSLNRFDVNGDGHVRPGDALDVINRLNSFAPGKVPDDALPGPLYYDVNGNGILAASDALDVINQLNSFGNSEGEAEGSGSRVQGPGNGQLGPGNAELLLLLATDVAAAKRREVRF